LILSSGFSRDTLATFKKAHASLVSQADQVQSIFFMHAKEASLLHSKLYGTLLLLIAPIRQIDFS
jgi:hypothetical protein